MKLYLNLFAKSLFAMVLLNAVSLNSAADSQKILINNVSIFDGTNEEIVENRSVLIHGDSIVEVSEAKETVPDEIRVIDAANRVLMPGLIDAHWHAFLAATPFSNIYKAKTSYLHLVAAEEARKTLMRGVTTVRDVGGPVFGLKRAIDQGVTSGPRIYPSGAIVSQTSGHGDFRQANEAHPHFGGHHGPAAEIGFALIADGVAEVKAAVREQLKNGAAHIKLMAGGGVSSEYDPLDVTQYSIEELKAAVDSAEDWGTYVMVHAYTPRAVNRAIDAGVKVIEHGHLLDKKTLKRMAKKGVWLSTQPFFECSDPLLSPEQNRKLSGVCEGSKKIYKMSNEVSGLKVAWGTDLLQSSDFSKLQVQKLVDLKAYYSSFELLKMATGGNAELLGLTGKRNPYPKKLGVIQEGAYADLLLVDGNPMESIELLADKENLLMIVKNGIVYKNTL
ncbi:metal-dependent hydrolase family protein [Pseudoteredinibacter isoporae]|uniref:metal-dependent hydrolase family protein n=1 Tax=Pseudoteredinibacter isoporae TaxID=570281 RepID=UPI003107CA23